MGVCVCDGVGSGGVSVWVCKVDIFTVGCGGCDSVCGLILYTHSTAGL